MLPMDDDRGKRAPPIRGAKATMRPGYSVTVPLAVCGDPVIGRALALLLGGSRYDAKYLDAASLREPGALDGVRIVLLTPTPGSERSEVPLAALRDAPGGVAEVPVLRLLSFSGRTRAEGEQDRSEYAVPWPCSTEELKRRIETALLAAPGSKGKSPTEIR